MVQPNARDKSFTKSWLFWAFLFPLVIILPLVVVSDQLRSNTDEHGSTVPATYFDTLSRVLQLSKDTPNVSTSTTSSFLNVVKSRRSWYWLDKNLPTSQEKIVELVQDAMQAVPSAFNSQTNRAIVLFGTEHEKLWEIVAEILQARVTADQWDSTSQKIAGFKAAAGTVLFFVDTEVVQSYVENIPSYATEFPVWATQSDAMLQHTIWSTLSAERIGANLQHYNPLIDAKVAETWSLPLTWRLTAELVFGGGVGPKPTPKDKDPVNGKVQVFGVHESESV